MRNEDLRESPPQKINCPILITPSLVLRLPHIDDVAALKNLVESSSWAKQSMETAFPYFQADAEDFIKCANDGEVGSYIYAITHSETGEFLGSCGISGYKAANDSCAQPEDTVSFYQNGDMIVDAHSDRHKTEVQKKVQAEIFFWLGRPYRGQGYGYEVATVLADTIFRATDVENLYARVANTNTSSARQILQDCGFSLQYQTPSPETAQACAHYGLDRDKWLDLRAATA